MLKGSHPILYAVLKELSVELYLPTNGVFQHSALRSGEARAEHNGASAARRDEASILCNHTSAARCGAAEQSAGLTLTDSSGCGCENINTGCSGL